MNVSYSLCHLFFVVEKWKIWGFSRRFEFVAFLSYFKKHTEQKDINYFCLSSVLLFQFSVFRRQTEKKGKNISFQSQNYEEKQSFDIWIRQQKTAHTNEEEQEVHVIWTGMIFTCFSFQLQCFIPWNQQLFFRIHKERIHEWYEWHE
jgi:hypothetical protein